MLKKTIACVAGCLLGVFAAGAFAQDAPKSAAKPTIAEAPQLSRELELERDIAKLKIEKLQLQNDLKSAQTQLAVLSQLLQAQLQADANKAATNLEAELKPVEEKLVKALGGDLSKGDRYDWRSGTLVKRGS